MLVRGRRYVSLPLSMTELSNSAKKADIKANEDLYHRLSNGTHVYSKHMIHAFPEFEVDEWYKVKK